MGVQHVVQPLHEECIRWLEDLGVSYPKPPVTSRFPTPREVTTALQELSDFKFKISADISSGEWTADITAISNPDAWACLRVSEYESEDEPHDISFRNGWPEVIFAVVERISHHCGPLVVVNDSDMVPVVVCSNDSVEELLRRAESVQESDDG